MLTLGVTGSFATGKSTVVGLFKACGAKILDSDKIVHDLLKKDKACQKKIVKVFGQQILGKGGINKKRLAQIVFKDFKKLRQLEAIVHPRVKQYITQQIKRAPKTSLVVIEIPLLFEAGFDSLCDNVVVVTSPLALQLKRAKASRGISNQQIKERIKAQMPLKRKIQLADYSIDNSKNIKQTKRQVKELWQKLFPKKEK